MPGIQYRVEPRIASVRPRAPRLVLDTLRGLAGQRLTVTRPAPAPARYLSRLTTLRSGGGELSMAGPIHVAVVAGDPHQIAGKTPRDAAMPGPHQVVLPGVSVAMAV